MKSARQRIPAVRRPVTQVLVQQRASRKAGSFHGAAAREHIADIPAEGTAANAPAARVPIGCSECPQGAFEGIAQQRPRADGQDRIIEELVRKDSGVTPGPVVNAAEVPPQVTPWERTPQSG